MRNLLIIAVVFWVLFMNGFSYIKSFMSNSNLQNASTTVIKGTSTVASSAADTGRVAAVSRPAINVAARPSGQVVVVPQGMPELPTATQASETVPIETPLPTQPTVEQVQDTVQEQPTQDTNGWTSGGGPEIIVPTNAPIPEPTPTPLPEDVYVVGATVTVLNGVNTGMTGTILTAFPTPPYMVVVQFANGDAFSYHRADLSVSADYSGGGGSGWN